MAALLKTPVKSYSNLVGLPIKSYSNLVGLPIKSYSNLVGLPMQFDLDGNARQNGRILVASGARTRNRDYWSGKMLRFDPSGVRTDAWHRQGGLVLYMHDFLIPLAKSSIYLENGMLWAPDELQFHRRVIPVPAKFFSSTPGTFDTGVLADLWEQKYLNSVSIHITLDVSDEKNIVETEDEIVLGTSEMIEYSIVTVPGDGNSHRQAYEFMVNRGVQRDVAECLSCYVPTSNSRTFAMEAKRMDEQEDTQEEEVVEEEAADETVTESEQSVEMEVPMQDVIQALASSPEFISGLVQTVLDNPQLVQRLAQSLAQEMGQPRKFVLRLTSDEKPATAPAPQSLAFSANSPRQTRGQKAPEQQQANGRGKPNITRLVR